MAYHLLRHDGLNVGPSAAMNVRAQCKSSCVSHVDTLTWAFKGCSSCQGSKETAQRKHGSHSPLRRGRSLQKQNI